MGRNKEKWRGVGRPCCAALTLTGKESETKTDREQIVLLLQRESWKTSERERKRGRVATA